MSIRVLLADDQALFREGLDTLLSIHKDIEVVGQAANGQEAVDLSLKLRPDVILMDMQMPILNGIGATRRLKQSLPGSTITKPSSMRCVPVRLAICSKMWVRLNWPIRSVPPHAASRSLTPL
jgi:CheY-like chemotaxis protein